MLTPVKDGLFQSRKMADICFSLPPLGHLLVAHHPNWSPPFSLSRPVKPSLAFCLLFEHTGSFLKPFHTWIPHTVGVFLAHSRCSNPHHRTNSSISPSTHVSSPMSQGPLRLIMVEMQPQASLPNPFSILAHDALCHWLKLRASHTRLFPSSVPHNSALGEACQTVSSAP